MGHNTGHNGLADDKKYLEMHHNQWRVRVRIPEKVRHLFDNKLYLRQTLGTGNLKTANLLKGEHVSRFKRTIAEAVASVSPDATVWEEARVLRNRYSQAAPEERDDLLYEMIHRAEELSKGESTHLAKPFVSAAQGTSIPINDYLDAYIEDTAYRPKSASDLKRVMSWLEEWMMRKRLPPTLDSVTQPVAGDFMRYMVNTRSLSRKAASKYLSFVRGYWVWLEEHGHRPRSSSPWLGRLPKSKPPPRATVLEPDEGKRPFTDDEVVKLLTGNPTNSHMVDLMTIAALSGMRIEECYLLRVQDTVGGIFSIRAGKTVNAVRRVPIHSALEATVARLSEGKDPLDYLIDPQAELLEKTDLRSQAASKAFGHYRRGLGIDERPNGKRQSNVDFHSFRRWFHAKARDALNAGAQGFTAWTLSELVGHGTKDAGPLELTMKTYPGKSPISALKACVEAVQLPNKAKS